jgi:hypothetical protein
MPWSGRATAIKPDVRFNDTEDSKSQDAKSEQRLVWSALRDRPRGLKPERCHHQTEHHNDACRQVRQPVSNPIKPRPSSAGFVGHPRRSQPDDNECRCQAHAERRCHRYSKSELLYLNTNQQDGNRGWARQQTSTETEPNNVRRTSPTFHLPLMDYVTVVHVTVVVRMAMMMEVVATVLVTATARSQAQKHAHRKQCHKNPGQHRQPRLCLLGNHILTNRRAAIAKTQTIMVCPTAAERPSSTACPGVPRILTM